MNNDSGNNIILITGVMAAGKSSVAQALSERLNPSMHLRGDSFRRMIVNGRVDMSSEPDQPALEQLLLRYKASAETAKIYQRAGFHVVYQDTIVGPILADVVDMYSNAPLSVVVLCPSISTVAHREEARSKTGYGRVTIQQLHKAMEKTPRLGLWLDSSEQSVAETVQSILDNFDAAEITS
ncbi:MAG: AAA family ATPase [Pseudomonadales bacterium]